MTLITAVQYIVLCAVFYFLYLNPKISRVASIAVLDWKECNTVFTLEEESTNAVIDLDYKLLWLCVLELDCKHSPIWL